MFRANMKVLKSEIRKPVLTVFSLYIEIGFTITAAISDTNVIRRGDRLIGSALEIEKLCPGIDIQEILDFPSLYVFDRDILIMLGRIRAKFEPKQIVSRIYLNSANDNIAVMNRFGTAGQAPVTEAVDAVLYDDPLIGSVFLRLIGPGALPAL